jgi:hypothetical protein
VRREVLHGHNIQRRKELRGIAVFGGEESEERLDGLEHALGLLAAVYYNYQRFACGLPEKDRI